MHAEKDSVVIISQFRIQNLNFSTLLQSPLLRLCSLSAASLSASDMAIYLINCLHMIKSTFSDKQKSTYRQAPKTSRRCVAITHKESRFSIVTFECAVLALMIGTASSLEVSNHVKHTLSMIYQQNALERTQRVWRRHHITS